MHDTSTRSPGFTFLTPAPTDLDGADGLVAEDAPVGHLGNVALQDVQVGAADRDRVDADDRVGVVDDHRLGDLLPRLVVRVRGTRVPSSPDLRSAGTLPLTREHAPRNHAAEGPKGPERRGEGRHLARAGPGGP